jgi:gas vesicle protein
MWSRRGTSGLTSDTEEWFIVKKISLLIAAGTGYVLGTRAGRERYEQIKQQATKTWNNPKVQDTADRVQTQAKHAGADLGSKVGSKVAETASDVKDKVTDKVSSSSDRDDHQQPGTVGPGQGTS